MSIVKLAMAKASYSIASAFGCLLAIAKIAHADTPQQKIEMVLLADVPPPQLAGQVVHANPVPTANWPATLVFQSPTGAPCTATVVGSRTIITAAHCMSAGGQGWVKIRSAKLGIRCTRHPDYVYPYASADFALCVTNTTVPGMRYEKINTDPEATSAGAQIFLLGYGCIDVNGNRTQGTLYGGLATVKDPGDGNSPITLRGGAAICAGDSGGGAFTQGEARKLVGINASGDYETNSFLASTAAAKFLKWANGWAADQAVEICGLTDAATGCRGD
jgi:hypothetical protein